MRDATARFESLVTSGSEQRKCASECPQNCEELKFEVSMDTRMVIPGQVCYDREVMEAANKDISVR